MFGRLTWAAIPFNVPIVMITAGTVGVILGAVYLLYWAGRVVFGPLKEPAHDTAHDGPDANKAHAPVTDLSPREWAVLVPMAAMALFMGVYPQPVIRTARGPGRVTATFRLHLPHGSYRLSVRAIDAAGNHSQPASVHFTAAAR